MIILPCLLFLFEQNYVTYVFIALIMAAAFRLAIWR